MVTRTPNLFVRGLLRIQSFAAMATRPTQGYLATLRGSLYPHSLDVRIYTSCAIPTQLSNLLLPSDKADKVDLSSIMFRMQRAVGGSWTEYQKSDTILCHLISEQMFSLRLPNVRTCPFCKSNHGTPRHYVMECPETELYANDICDAVEGVLASLGCSVLLIDAAKKHFDTTKPAFVYAHSAVCSTRWPILSAWRWLVRIPAREDVLRTAPVG